MSNIALKYSVLGIVSTIDSGRNLQVVGEFDTETEAVDFIDKVARHQNEGADKPEWDKDVSEASVYNNTLHIVKTYVLVQERKRENARREEQRLYLRESNEKDRKRREVAEAAIKKAGLDK